jgi:hypothetical protein
MICKDIRNVDYYTTVSVEEFLNHKEIKFAEFEDQICYLQMIDINSLNNNSKYCFFFNLY